MSQKNLSSFEFKYEGNNYIDLNTLISSQFHFLATINEIQKELYPDASVNVKLGATKEGSFILELLAETTWIDTIFLGEKLDVAVKVIECFSGFIAVKKYLKGKKADKIEEKGNSIQITVGDNSPITIDKAVFNIYQNSPVINKAVEKNFELLERDEEIEGIKITEVKGKSKSELLKVDRDQFNDMTLANQYLSNATDKKPTYNERLFIKEPNLMPNKDRVWRWKFIHRGRDITAKITDKNFLLQINNGLRVGQGDCLVVDLVTHMRFDEQFNTFVETKKFEVQNVHRLVPRDEQTKLF